MKNIFFLCAMLLSICILAQDQADSIYFPQEQLVHPDCESKDDVNTCLDRILFKITKPVLENSILEHGSYQDTLKVRLSFAVDDNGDIINDYFWSTINDSLLYEVTTETIEAKLKKLPQFEIRNEKSDKYKPTHTFYYHFIKNSNTKNLQEIAIDSGRTYKGGDILEVPIFEGCTRTNSTEDRRCFQTRIQKHIARNFKYPKEAQNKNIQGRVSIMFHIEKDGSIGNIKTRGPSPILEEEAIRIIKLIPKIEPALKNGEEVRIPFSIPITFKLQ